LEWKQNQQSLDINRLVFIDESCAKTNMTRLYGRSAVGTRVHDSTPSGRRETTTMIGSIRASGQTTAMTIEAPADTDIFRQYIKCILCPTLKPGDIVIMDNLSVHKHPDIQKLIESKGASLRFLPAYSPELNPIEQMWSKVKAFLRQAKARTTDTLFDAIAQAFKTITPEDSLNFFSHCGYMCTIC
jgi:transposase